MAAPRIAMVAGEASGDLLASHLMAALARRLPGASFCGIGGPRMQAAAHGEVRVLHDFVATSTRGIMR